MPPGASRLFGETVFPVAHPSLGMKRLIAPTWLSSPPCLNSRGTPHSRGNGVIGWSHKDGLA